MGHLVLVTSDLHHLGAAQRVLKHARTYAGLDEFILAGDRSIAPDLRATQGADMLREAKSAAKAAGLSPEAAREAENALWYGPQAPVYVQQWLGVLSATMQLQHQFEQEVIAGRIPQVLDTGGNDDDKSWRVSQAYRTRERLTGKPRGIGLSEVMRSFAFRQLTQVESFRKGPTLDFRIPYTEDKEQAVLEGYLAQIEQTLRQQENGLRQVIMISHLNPDPALRRERTNGWYPDAYDLIRSYIGDTKLVHLFGHCHKLPRPYTYSGAQLVPIGCSGNRHRLAVLDYETGRREYIELTAGSPHPARRRF